MDDKEWITLFNDVMDKNATWTYEKDDVYDKWWQDEMPDRKDNIVLTGGGAEMLRIERDGFYVRGVKVPTDDNEAKAVYEAFKQWLSWTIMVNSDGN